MHERAGTPATESDLIDVEALVRAYYERKPDVSIPEQRVAFGTSGHRGSAFNTAFNEDHILAITQAIVEYRAAQGITGPLFIGADTHALSAPGADHRARRARRQRACACSPTSTTTTCRRPPCRTRS